MKPRKILIITSSGGGGLLQAALAKEQQELDRDPSVQIVKRDLLKDWYGKRAGAFSIRLWDRAQRAGNVATLTWIFQRQELADLIFWPRIFFCALRTLWREDIDAVFDTQPLGTSAVLCALRLFNFLRKKELFLEKISVDLPTESNTHFLRPIKTLSKKNRACLRLVSIAPLLKEEQTAEQFWQEYCALSEQEVHYGYVVRRSFLRWKEVKRNEELFSFSARIENAEERELLTNSLSRGCLKTEVGEHEVRFFIPPQDQVATILLGSQPANLATFNYVKGFILWARKKKRPLHLFVFCTHHHVGEHSLFSQIAELVIQEPNYPRNLTVVPFSMQSDEMIAPLFHRSDIACTRSGGQTAMELMCVMHGQIWIHSEAKVEGTGEPTLDQLLQGILGWEAGNALYLHKMAGAKLITPELFLKMVSESPADN